MYTQKRIVSALIALAVLLTGCGDVPETHTPANHTGRPTRPGGAADVVETWPAGLCWELDDLELVHPTDPPCAAGAPHWRCSDEAFDAGYDTLAEIGIPGAVCRWVTEPVVNPLAPWVCCSREP